ncbi:MAG: hypothetical protein IT349_04860 [Candidatus Eisenbacteria bacterium]|nr:hypothetical protein [Candidatus Eisenbacteria bacterium]MCC7141413.1 hypothetical protein [Candidatus Eisenbacteria bacterium]
MTRSAWIDHVRRIDERTPALVWALAIPAAISIAIALLVQVIPRPPLSSVMRGFRPQVAAGEIVLRAPRKQGEHAVGLRWHRGSEVDRYEIRLYDACLDELQRFDSGADSSFVLRSTDLGGAVSAGRLVAYRVIGSLDGIECAASRVGVLRLP